MGWPKRPLDVLHTKKAAGRPGGRGMLGGIGDSRGNDMGGGGGGVGRGEFFGGNIRSGWRKCVFEGKKGFLGKIATTILFGGGGKNQGGWPPRYPPKISPQ